MRRVVFPAILGLVILATTAATAGASVCVSIDQPNDTLSPEQRASAILLITKAFHHEGQLVVTDGCTGDYVLSHVRLGDVIIVTLSGPQGQREGRALGLDDLPALYSQLVRSLFTGKPMSGFNVVDRTNVTRAQSGQPRVEADSFFYLRLGYGATFAGGAMPAPGMGLGYRVELDRFAVDASFFNYQIHSAGGGASLYGAGQVGSESQGGITGSILKLEGLYFLKPAANASPYLGGGLSWGGTALSQGARTSQTNLQGTGLQGELTMGYELPRASTVRLFVQADAILPLYRTSRESVTSLTTAPYYRRESLGRQYTPTIALSIGLGWQRHGRP